MANTPERSYEELLSHLRETPKPKVPVGPHGKKLQLSLLVSYFRVSIAVLLPVLSVGLFLTPLLAKLIFGVAYLKPLRNVFGLAALGLIVAWYRAFISKKHEVEPVLQFERRTDHKLYELADAVADAVGSPTVDTISMSPHSKFGVSETTKGGRRLHLSLDYCDFESLNLAEFASILAREFAHFSKGHAKHALRLSRNTRFLNALERQLAEGSWKRVNPIYLALRLFDRCFQPLLASISREHESQADAMAVGLLGARTFSTSFRKTVRTRLRAELLLEGLLESAVKQKRSNTDLIEAMATRELDQREQAELADSFDALVARETAPLDFHPSIRARSAHATELRKAAGDFPELVGSESAYNFLLQGRRIQVQRALSKEMVEKELGIQSTEIGLRGEPVRATPGSALPSVMVRKFRTSAWLMWLVGSALGLFLFGTLSLIGPHIEDAPVELRRVALLGTAVFLVALVVSGRARAVRVQADETGLDLVGFLGTTRVSWEDVTSLRLIAPKLRVSATNAGTATGITVRGDAGKRLQLGDLILERSPVLAYHAWGTGLARVANPGRTAQLPTRVYELDEDLHIEGPGATNIVIEKKDPREPAIREHLERRLLTAMLGVAGASE